MKDTLYVKEINAFGTTLYKPVNDVAHQFTLLTGNKNLSAKELARIELLGFKIEFINEYNSIKVI